MPKIYGVTPVKIFGVAAKKINGIALTTTYDRSIPVTVIASAYDTSGNGGRKVVRLSNGWLVCVVAAPSGLIGPVWYKSIDNGVTWTRLCYADIGAVPYALALVSYGTNVYTMFCLSGGTANWNFKFDATTVTNTDRSGYAITLDSAQSSSGPGCSITCDSSVNLYAAWCSKNATYPNSFNIRHAKSTDGGATWKKADGSAGIDQITIYNISTTNMMYPSIVINSSGYPVIIASYSTSASNAIVAYRWTGAAWSSSTVYTVATAAYGQNFPSAVVSPDNSIHVVWAGMDSTDTTKYNIRYSKSTDGGATWSAMDKRTSGNTYDQQYPSITADKSNNLYIEWQGRASGTYDQIRKMIYNGSWGAASDLTANTTANAASPSTCSNHTDFTDPLCVYQDNQAIAVKFRGIWAA